MSGATQLVTVDPDCYTDRVEIARGGMGRISAAHDLRLGRTVALKELCIDSRETRARLAREALLTARLAHPSIVSVHEAGRWPNGMPFFAMKLVPGRSLDRVIAERATLAERLALLPHILAVADALAYAHQQRVIHRDLKPHNVLVGEFGETVVVDWGVAKELDRAEREETSGPHAQPDPAATVDGAVIGTPAYMPPEQAAGAQVDERADVYAIGAMLYHLLAGHAPYGSMAGVAIVETLQEAPPASLAELVPDAPADLLAIAARAMARDPEARYATARGLADDLRRYHAGQLVGAHRYSWRELACRWLQRNRRSVAVAAVSLLTLVAFGVVTLTRIVHAEHVAQDERIKAERHRADAEELLEFMLGDLGEKLRPVNQLGLLESVAHKARDYFEHRPDDLGSDDLRKHAVALLGMGDVLAANGHTAGALGEYQRARELARGLVLMSPNAAAMRDVLANAHAKIGEVVQAQGDVQRALGEYRAALGYAPTELPYLLDLARTYDRLGDGLERHGDPAQALQAFRVELALRAAVATTDPTNPAIRREIAHAHLRAGNVLRLQGDTTAALGEYTTALALDQAVIGVQPSNALAQRDLALAQDRIGATMIAQNNGTAALGWYRAALVIRERLAAADPANLALLRDVSISHFHIADLLSDDGDLTAALPEYRADLDITERLAAADPNNLDTQRDLHVSRSRLGGILLAQGKTVESVAAYRRALELAERIAAADRSNLLWQHDLAISHRRLADALSTAGQWNDALLEYRVCLALGATLVARAPTNVQWQRNLALAHAFVGKALLEIGERGAAIEEMRRDLELSQRVSAHDPANASWKREVEDSQHLLATTLAMR